MNEEPKSIWKKSLTGWRGLLVGWLILMSALIIIFLIWLKGTGTPMAKAGEEFQLFGVVWIAVTIIILLAAFIRWLFCWRNLKRTLFGLACIATLVALFYAEENWRGKRAWENYVREREAAGEKMDWKSYIPPQIPDDQNLAMCPLLKPILDYSQTNTSTAFAHTIWNDTNGIARVQRLEPRWSDGYQAVEKDARLNAEKFLNENEFTNHAVNLAAWQNYFRTGTNLDGIANDKTPAQDVLLALRFLKPDLDELQNAAEKRPLTRWPLHYETYFLSGILLPHLADIRQLVRTLRLRAAARLAVGDTTGGFSDIQLGLRLINPVADDPFLISLLVRESALQDILQPLREGLARQQFSESQLATVQQQLSVLDFFVAYHNAFQAERPMRGEWSKLSAASLADFYRGMSISSTELKRLILLMRFAPKGWIYENQLTLCRLQDKFLLQSVDVGSHQVNPSLANQLERAILEQPERLTIITRQVFSFKILEEGPEKTAFHQTVLNQAIIACALGRYRLAHASLPESLDALTPQFMAKVPNDVVGGHPLKYRRTADGENFLMYSVGWNEKDDGGVTVFKTDSATSVNIEQGDWVWRYPKGE